MALSVPFADWPESCESLRWSRARCLPPAAKALSHTIVTGKAQNAASANCYFKGKGNRPLLALTMLHIFSQWGSLMCEQGSGRAVNRAFYEAARGELGCQWRGLSHICHAATLGPGLFVLMAARDWPDCRPCLHWMYVKQEIPLPTRTDLWGYIRTAGVVHLETLVYTGGTGITWRCLVPTDVWGPESCVRHFRCSIFMC